MGIEDRIKTLEGKLTGDMIKDMEVKEELYKLKKIRDGIKPRNTEVECVGCGS